VDWIHLAQDKVQCRVLMLGNSCVTDQLMASQELGSMELVNYYIIGLFTYCVCTEFRSATARSLYSKHCFRFLTRTLGA
jgi:hypothetical protein